MEYQALYRKYRPEKFSDVVDQESILKILTNSIKENKISHAYLFSGPRGTGKTTIAKLVAKTVNCLNLGEDFSICHKCENCLDIDANSSDIIEIDAASNNGVDEIRELKSKINLVPNKLKYKVYIIDEVHMLSISAFNALLKTLEEPPSHVIFILATTEFYKVPTTIVSRCQCLNFTRIKTSSIEKRLQEVAKQEKIKITDDAIHEVALYADGGMRDALGMLDKLASYSLKEITAEDFLKINGLISKSDMEEFINLILTNKTEEVLKTLDKFDELGYDFSKLIEKLLEELRDLLVLEITGSSEQKQNPDELYSLIMCFNETYNLLKEAANRRIIVEVKLLMFMNRKNKKQEDNVSINEEARTKENEVKQQERKEEPRQEEEKKSEPKVLETKEVAPKVISQEIPNTPNLKASKTYQINEKVKIQRINNTFALASKLLKNMALSKWQDLSGYLTDDKYEEVAGLLKDCTLGVVSNTNIILTTKYPSVIDKIYLDLNLITELLNKILGNTYKLVILSDKEFQEEVLKYKEHMKDENYYSYQEETEEFIIYPKVEVENNKEVCYSNLVQKAIDVFGSEYVEVE